MEPVDDSDNSQSEVIMDLKIDPERKRFPFCIVWTPLPIISAILPIIGHMGIATSTGVIRDFAGPYTVSEDNLAFGSTTKYWQLDYKKCRGAVKGWDSAVSEASDVYKTRMHNLFLDNCHSHVSMALNLMSYDNSTNWNMGKLALFMFIYGKYVSFYAYLRTWGPCYILNIIIFSILYFNDAF